MFTFSANISILRRSVLCLIFFTIIINAQTPTGIIKGKVIDAVTKEALIGVTVVVLKTTTGTASNETGEFIINKMPAGNYTIEFRFVGYGSRLLTDVQVQPGRITKLDVELKESVYQQKDVTITAKYFDNIDASSQGLVTFNSEEIRRSPGSMGDVSRILMSLPSTAKVSDDNNDLVVRGGSPSENGFYVDGIPVPNINHFPNIGSTGGPIGILNVDYIDQCNLLTSGFISSFGDKLSSTVDIKFREGNRDAYDLQADLNWAGFGGGVEGPLPSKAGSWMASYKRSYLDFFSQAAGWNMIIRYGDGQAKVTFDLDKNHKLSILDIYADDYETYGRKDAIEQGGRFYGKIDNFQNTAGLSWRALWTPAFYSITNFSHSVQSFKNDFDKVSTGGKYYVSNNEEQAYNLKNTNFLQINKFNKLEFGIDLKHETAEYNYTKFADTNSIGIYEPDFTLNTKVEPDRYGIFFTYITTPVKGFTASLGCRIDRYELSGNTTGSPRVSISYEIAEGFSLNANTGVFYQQLPLVLLSQSKSFHELDQMRAYHYGFGLEYLLAHDTRLTLEGYDKEYTHMPLSSDQPALCLIDGGLSGNKFGNYNNIVMNGKGYTRGVEMMIQKKMSDDFYGIVSGSFFRSRYRDLNGTWRDRTYDNKVIFSFIAGYKPSVDWELSARWVFAGGTPYTPFDMDKSTSARMGISDDDRTNSARYDDYHSLNIRIDKKFFFSSQCLDIYLSVWNAYNRKNIADYAWNTDKNKSEAIYQWTVMPIFGVKYTL